MRQVKIIHLVITLPVFLIAVLFFIHQYVSKLDLSESQDVRLISSEHLDQINSDSLGTSRKLKNHIDELHKIRVSVSNELRELESRRSVLQSQISKYNSDLENIRSIKEKIENEIKITQLTLEQLKLEKDEMHQKFMPLLKAPVRTVFESSFLDTVVPSPENTDNCYMDSCFDYSVCSVFSGFQTYIYHRHHLKELGVLEKFIDLSVWKVLENFPQKTYDPKKACVFVVMVGQRESENMTRDVLEKELKSLPYWRGDGRNHLLVNMLRKPHTGDIFSGVDTGRAILVQSSFAHSFFRRNFDVVIPPTLGKSSGELWEELPPISPVRRKYFLTFVGNFNGNIPKKGNLQETKVSNKGGDTVLHYQNQNLFSVPELHSSFTYDLALIQHLKEWSSSTDSGVVCTFKCDTVVEGAAPREWSLCGTAADRRDLMEQSTFTLIVSPVNTTSSSVLQIRLFECLKYGSVPVILGDYVELPFSEIIDWKKAAIILAKPRVTEIQFILRTFTDNDIAYLRRHGRFLYETYFGSTSNIMSAVLAVIRSRLSIPAPPVEDTKSPVVLNTSYSIHTMAVPEPNQETDEVLGPLEAPFSSTFFKQNYSHYMSHKSFQHFGDPFSLFPATPFEKNLPSESKFLGSGFGFRPVGKGAGGSGKEFSECLGGNLPREQFTIVMLTYERETVLMGALQRLKGLPYLNKVLVVWNNPLPPASYLKWPEIHVPIKVLKMEKNSLNNRFLPFDEIETEAVLSIDDDAHLRHDEIVFGFRVWREERERLVGFPGRFHAWDASSNAWLYNSNYSCELSMVLTGAAFFHKYYMYLYSYSMPKAIREKVDEFMNCEDIAMNFLVSHVVRKPPIKVTSRWTFRCPGCPVTLSNDNSHFEERHKCINYFVRVYGYMPLLYTQFRADSVLFKTRLPKDKQKCFKFI